MLKKIFSSQLRVNVVSGTTATVVNFITMAIAFRVYLQFLGYERYGIWLILGTVLSFVQMGGNLGIQPAVTKLVAEGYGRNDIEWIQRCIAMALFMLVLTGFVGLVVVLCFKSLIVEAFKLSGDNAVIASQLLPYIGVLSIYIFVIQVLDGALAGLGRMDLTNYCQTAGRVIILVIASILMVMGWGVKSLLIANIISCILIHGIFLLFIRRIVPIRILRTNNMDFLYVKKLLHFGSGIVVGSFLGMLIGPLNKLMLSRFVGPAAIPVYEMAYSGSIQVRGMIESGLRALMPEISRIGVDKSKVAKDTIYRIYTKAFKLVFVGGLPMFGITMLVLYFSPILKLWLGNKFTNELPGAFCIMLLAFFLSLVGVPAYYTIMGLGKVRHIVVSHAFLAGLNAILVILAAYTFTSLSVSTIAWITVISSASTTIYLLFQKHRLIMR